MKKITLILSIIFMLFSTNSCRTKKVLKNQSTEIEKTEVKEVIKAEQQEVKKETEQKKEETVKEETKTEDKKDIQIIGKTDTENPLLFYNIINGDTIDLFKVTGNADVIFKSSKNNSNSSYNSQINTIQSKESNSSNQSSSIIDKASETVKEVQTKSVEVVKKNFSFGIYLTFFLGGLVIITILVGIMWLRKSTYWTKILNFFKR